MSGCGSDSNSDSQDFTEINPPSIDATPIEPPIIDATPIEPPIVDASDIGNAMIPITVLPTLPQSAVHQSYTRVIDSGAPLMESTYVDSYNFHLFEERPSYPVRTTSMRIFDVTATMSTNEASLHPL